MQGQNKTYNGIKFDQDYAIFQKVYFNLIQVIGITLTKAKNNSKHYKPNYLLR